MANENAELSKKRIEKKNDELVQKELQLKIDTEAAEKRLQDKADADEQKLESMKNDFLRIQTEALQVAPWLSEMYADFLYSIDLSHANYLSHKKNPATKAADIVRKVSAEKREAVKQLKLLQYQMNVFETVAPWLEEFKDVNAETIQSCLADSEDEDIKTDFDSVKRWLSKDEYDKLSSASRYQLALDRYKQSRKTRWEVGRDYERYIGYFYESLGHKVEFFGATTGLEDMGRDLIVHRRKGGGVVSTAIVQCKYWNEKRTIHEKHIFQLYGTSVMYRIEHNLDHVGKAFVTTAPLSETAKAAAQLLEIHTVEVPFDKNYPCIKCNINFSTGERIYHLPFDQQYDKIRIDFSKGELYAYTVAEAEAHGFRRAMRWKGSHS